MLLDRSGEYQAVGQIVRLGRVRLLYNHTFTIQLNLNYDESANLSIFGISCDGSD